MSDATDAIQRLHLLASETGKQLLDRLAREEITPDTELKLGAQLRKEFPVSLVLDALGQHQLRLKASAKFSRAMEMFFTKAGLEQASSEVIAQYRAKRFTGTKNIADLCCGIGGDLIQLAKDRATLAVDRDPLHLQMAKLNADVYGVGNNVTLLEADVRDVQFEGIDGVFVDPARRTADKRLPTGKSEPPLDWCLNLQDKVAKISIKAAPGIDHEDVPNDWELEFIAVGKDLKESVLWSPALATAKRRATILPQGHTMTPEPGDAVAIEEPGEYLLDPNPAVTRAGLVEELARQLNAWKIDQKIAFLSSNSLIKSPFCRTLKVIDSAPWIQKQIPARLKAHDIGSVDIRRRGLAGDIDQFHRTLKLTGSRQATLVMTRMQEKPWALICLNVD